MLLPLALAAVLGSTCTRSIDATSVLPELPGVWRVLSLSGLDRAKPDTMLAEATIETDLRECLLRERLVGRSETPPYESLSLWGVNGPDSTIQRVFVHSQHGRFGIYQGRRAGSVIALRQVSLGSQPDAAIVENRVEFTGRDRFSISSRISSDTGRTWKTLSRRDYQRTSP
jgi:hypothetical protein